MKPLLMSDEILFVIAHTSASGLWNASLIAHVVEPESAATAAIGSRTAGAAIASDRRTAPTSNQAGA
jgi:hypothetical protein